MNKTIYIFLLVISININAFPQFTGDIKNKKYPNSYSQIVKLQPYQFLYGSTPLVGEYGFGIERKAGLKSSIQADVAYLGKGLIYLSLEDSLYEPNEPHLTMNGFRVQVQYRFYLTKFPASKGLFIAPHFSYASVKYSYDGTDDNIQVIHLDYSIISGWQFVFGKLSFEGFIGATYRQRLWIENYSQQITKIDDDEINDAYLITSPIRPKIGFSVGFAF